MKAGFGNAIGPYEDLQTSVKRRKLKWYGHVTRSSGLAKTILQGTVQGGRRRGRQRKRWEDNIKEWTGLVGNIILRKAENREEWRKLVVKSRPNGQPDYETGEGMTWSGQAAMDPRVSSCLGGCLTTRPRRRVAKRFSLGNGQNEFRQFLFI